MEFTLQQPKGRCFQVCWTDGGVLNRVSTGTRNEAIAKERLRDAEAADRMGLGTEAIVAAIKGKAKKKGPATEWDDFRDLYRRRVPTPRPKTWLASENRLNIAESLVNPKTIGEMASHATLKKLRDRLVEKYPSRHSAKSRLQSVIAALRWAEAEGMIEHVAKVPGIPVAKLKKMKGRPLTEDEFKAYLAAVPKVVGDKRAEEWQLLAKGIKAQGLRLEEALNMHWTDGNYLRPNLAGEFPVLEIPAAMQKNDTEEDIPLLPDFVELVEEWERKGWVFKLNPIRHKDREARDPEWVGKVLARVGREAGIETAPGKFASAHDLRRTCAQNMIDAGCDPEDVQRVMRHGDFETTRKWYASKRVQKSAQDIAKKMKDLRSQKGAHSNKSEST